MVKYAQDLPPALRGISFTVKPTEKIGVVRVPYSLPTAGTNSSIPFD